MGTQHSVPVAALYRGVACHGHLPRPRHRGGCGWGYSILSSKLPKVLSHVIQNLIHNTRGHDHCHAKNAPKMSFHSPSMGLSSPVVGAHTHASTSTHDKQGKQARGSCLHPRRPLALLRCSPTLPWSVLLPCPWTVQYLRPLNRASINPSIRGQPVCNGSPDRCMQTCTPAPPPCARQGCSEAKGR
jgi:hypothetical protein